MPPTATARNKRTHASGRRALRGVVGLCGAILVVAGAVWIGLTFFTAGAQEVELLTYTVQPGDLTVSFSERGNIEAAQSKPINCELDGSSTIVSIVPEGTYVQEGDLLVELDASSLELEINEQEIKVRTAQATLTQAENELAIQESQNQSDLDLARLTLKIAELELTKYLEGDWTLAVETADSDIFIAREELERARNEADWTRRLAEKGYVTMNDLTADELAVKKSEVRATQSQRQKEVLLQYTHLKDKLQYESDVDQATAALERTLKKNEAYLAKAQAELEAQRSNYNLSLERLQKLKDQYSKTRIYAPQDGLVVYAREGRRGRDDRIIEQGATVRQNQQLIELPDVSTMSVSVQVHESRIDQLTIGTPAFVSVDALPHLSLRGKVSKIGILPDSVNRWLNPDLKVYRTDITLDSDADSAAVRPGMSAKVELVAARLRNILYVPVQSVTTVQGVHHCAVREGSEFVMRKVTIGQFNESFVEITEGLAAGDDVMLQAPQPEGQADPTSTLTDEEIPEVVRESGGGWIGGPPPSIPDAGVGPDAPVPGDLEGPGRRGRGGERGEGRGLRERGERGEGRGGRRGGEGFGGRGPGGGEGAGGGEDGRGRGRRRFDPAEMEERMRNMTPEQIEEMRTRFGRGRRDRDGDGQEGSGAPGGRLAAPPPPASEAPSGS